MTKTTIKYISSLIELQPDIVIGDVSLNEFALCAMLNYPVVINDRNRYIERLMLSSQEDGEALWMVCAGVYGNYFVKKQWDKLSDNTLLSSWRRFVYACDFIETGGRLDQTGEGMPYVLKTFEDLMYLVSYLSNCGIYNMPVAQFLDSQDFGLLYIDNTEKSLPLELTGIDVPAVCLVNNNFELRNPLWRSFEAGDKKLISNLDLGSVVDACARIKANS